MIASQRKLHALIIRSSLAVSKNWLHIRNRLQRLPVFSPGDTCNNPRLTGCHGKYQEHKNSAQSSGKIPCGQCYQTGRLQCRPCRSDPYPAVLYGVFADGVLISRKPDTLASDRLLSFDFVGYLHPNNCFKSQHKLYCKLRCICV